jgi:mRNA interferase MazF
LGCPGSEDRQIFTLVPHTTALRGTAFEVSVAVRFLEKGGFDAQGISTVSTVKLMRKLGRLSAEELRDVEDAVLRWLGIQF